MNIPYQCPHCDRVSTRKWNLSIHIGRRHKGKYNPFLIGKKMVLTDSQYQSQNGLEFSNSFSPKINYSDPLEVQDRLDYMNNLLKELRKLSKVELGRIINEMRNFPQLR
jgi:hypothetical protein